MSYCVSSLLSFSWITVPTGYPTPYCWSTIQSTMTRFGLVVQAKKCVQWVVSIIFGASWTVCLYVSPLSDSRNIRTSTQSLDAISCSWKRWFIHASPCNWYMLSTLWVVQDFATIHIFEVWDWCPTKGAFWPSLGICWRWNIPIVGWCENLGHLPAPVWPRSTRWRPWRMAPPWTAHPWSAPSTSPAATSNASWVPGPHWHRPCRWPRPVVDEFMDGSWFFEMEICRDLFLWAFLRCQWKWIWLNGSPELVNQDGSWDPRWAIIAWD